MKKTVYFFLALVATCSPRSHAQGSWELIGRSGVPAMHAAVTTERKIVIIDKAEPSEITLSDGTYAWASEYDFTTNAVRPLRVLSNSFCSAGSFLGNGTLLNGGGDNRILDPMTPAQRGYQTIRLFNPCDDEKCEFVESTGLRMSSNRWYPAMITIPDGRVLIVGGSLKGQGAVAAQYNNPTYEFFPRQQGEQPNYELPILRESIPNNLYPQLYIMPDGTMFVLSNKQAVLYDYIKHQTVKTLPTVPGVARTYPLTGSSALLPLDPEKNYKVEIVVCGGAYEMVRTVAADNTCIRIDPMAENPQWSMEEMPNRRTMPDMVLLADGNVMIVNGAQIGFAGYSNAREPQFTPILYEPYKPEGNRMTLLAPSDVPRVYHSVATLLPDGRVWAAGSNPHSRISPQTEFRVDAYTPDYLRTGRPRPTIEAVPSEITYGQEFSLTLDLGEEPAENVELKTVLANLGFVTHSTHMSQRQTIMRNKVVSSGRRAEVKITAPENANLFPPGKHFIYVLYKGVPAVAKQVHIH
ncbi:uncharacterized protein VTP21DRAFT_258 [Calcarisporiella thermophila]|uniref:uncharacterized protein n=1 Tax=Calcarisporiella thermophila TaxID=911321 RepID=UPI00374214A5